MAFERLGWAIYNSRAALLSEPHSAIEATYLNCCSVIETFLQHIADNITKNTHSKHKMTVNLMDWKLV